MVSIRCTECETTVPDGSLCLACGVSRDSNAVPNKTTDSELLSTRLSTKAADADHPSITFDSIRSEYGRYDRPLADYLFAEEQPLALFELEKLLIECYDDTSWAINSGFWSKFHLLISDSRILVIAPGESQDQVLAVPFEDVVSVDTEMSWWGDKIVIEDAEQFKFTYLLHDTTGDDFDEAVRILEVQSKRYESVESQAVTFLQEIDAAIDTSINAEEAFARISKLFADRDEETAFDHAVSEAESLNELMERLSRISMTPDRALPTPVENAENELQLNPPRRSLQREVAYTLQHADPADVGKYVIAGGVLFGSMAVTAPFSTTAGLAAIALSSAATGAYASAHPESTVGQIDPIAVAASAKGFGARWAKSDAPGGKAVGNALGGFQILAQEVAPEEYAHWLANVDSDLIMEGAERGAKAALTNPNLGSQRQGALLGGGFGLAYSYIRNSDDLSDLEPLLDDDLLSQLRSAE